jgi:maltose alpha-D-glucosyltransferase/alpha-amylase
MTVNEPVHDTFEDTPAKDRDPEWFKRAVFYEVLVRSFQDSNGDGIGDLKGITAKLDYLQWLGVDCLWLPPFFKSPLRDGGYDVSDYTAVLPEFGDLADFVEFVDSAHQRGMRVIIDFVMNHTSDQHPWFQESRKDPDGPYGDYYMWADDDKQYPDARIIFVDTEASNWTFDPVRKQYFWHRFFSHQPDLNYENPAVQEEILAALRFWLDLGIDGFRLDAVPYSIAAEGTNCENLPASHEFLKRVRRDRRDVSGHGAAGGGEPVARGRRRLLRRLPERRGRVPHGIPLPRDATDLHGGPPGVPLPRLGNLAKTPADSPGCQWGIFLRNHDELTLEMVTDEERDYMWAEYAKDPRMRANIGIRRRLATAAGQRPQPDRTLHRPAAVPPRLADPLLRRRDRHGRQHLARRPRRRPHPDAVDTRPQRGLLRPATPAGSSCRRSWTPSTATRSPTSRRRCRRPPRCCTGPAA